MRHIFLVMQCVAALSGAWGLARGSPDFRQRSQATLLLSADERALQHLVLLRQTDDREAQPVRAVLNAGELPSERVLAFDCIPGEYIVRSDHLISAPVAIDARTCDTPHRATLFAAGWVRGRVVTQGKLPPPEVVSVTVTLCRAGRAQEAVGTYRVRAAVDGTIEAAVPADCLDLTIGARGTALSLVPRLSVTLGEVRQIGSYTLIPAAVLRVLAQSSAGDPLPGALVTVLAADEYEAFLRGWLRNESPQSGEQHRADGEGRTAFTPPLRPLTYVVVRSGDLIGFGGPVEMPPGSTTDICVRVSPGAKVRFIVAGERSWIDGEQRLVVLATPQISGQWSPGSNRLVYWSDSDAVTATLPIGGPWLFELCLQQPGGLQRLEKQTVEIAPGIDSIVQFSIGRSRFRGKALVGDTPRSGMIVLTQPESGDQVTAKVDEEGSFNVWLVRADRYTAQFSSDDGTVRRAKGIAEFVDPHSTTTVRFATASVSGIVVSPSGSGAAGATVTAKPAQLDDPAAVQEPGFGVKADDSGRFTFQSLGTGDWEINASLQARAAWPQIVTLVDGVGTPALRLILEHDRTVNGRVIDATLQPLAMASGWAVAEPTEPGEIPAVVEFQTDKQGYFRIMLDRPARGAVQIAIASRGYPATAFRITPADNAAVTLTVPRSGAEVRLMLPNGGGPASGLPRDWNLYCLVNDQGALLPMGFVLSTQAAFIIPTQTSTTLLIPRLAPGQWRLAKFADLRSSLLFLAGVGSLPELQRFVLTPPKGVSLDLRKERSP